MDAARLRAAEASPDGVDDALWARLAEANLLGLALPEPHGGLGFGFLELCSFLEEIGRALAPVPALATLVLGALPIAEFGTPEQRARWLPEVAAGRVLLSAALEDAGSADPAAPATRTRAEGDGWRALRGEARRALRAPRRPRAGARRQRRRRRRLPGRPRGPRRRAHAGTALERRAALRRCASRARCSRPRTGSEALRSTAPRPRPGSTSARSSRAQRSRPASPSARSRMTADYVRERVQFGVPIGSFQAVQHRCADAFIDLEALRWSAWRAAWRLAEGLPAAREAAVAKFWAADARLPHRQRGAAPARRPRRRRRLPDPPLLPLVEGARARPRRRRAAAGLAGEGHGPQRARGAVMTRTLRLADVKVGDELPGLDVPLTAAVIVGGALASRDFTPVHHDRSAAAGPGHAGRLHEHPDHQRLRRTLRHRLGRSGRGDPRPVASSSARRTWSATR